MFFLPWLLNDDDNAPVPQVKEESWGCCSLMQVLGDEPSTLQPRHVKKVLDFFTSCITNLMKKIFKYELRFVAFTWPNLCSLLNVSVKTFEETFTWKSLFRRHRLKEHDPNFYLAAMWKNCVKLMGRQTLVRQPFSRWTRASRYQNVSVLDSIGAKDDGDGGNNSSYKTYKALVKLSSPSYHHQLCTGRMPFLSPNQQCRSTEGRCVRLKGDGI